MSNFYRTKVEPNEYVSSKDQMRKLHGAVAAAQDSLIYYTGYTELFEEQKPWGVPFREYVKSLYHVVQVVEGELRGLGLSNEDLYDALDGEVYDGE